MYIELLNNIPIASNCNILLADKTGDMVVAECTPTNIRIRNKEEGINGDSYICTVNNFTSKEMVSYDDSNGNEFDSLLRYKTVCDCLSTTSSYSPIDELKNLLTGKYGFICQYKKELNFDTIWSSIFNLSTLEIYRAEGNPKNTKYITDLRLVTKK